MIREATPSDLEEIYAVINDGALAYKDVIPADRWHEPYMSRPELRAEIEAGINFSCFIENDVIQGVMGVQDKGAVVLVRHAYVRTSNQRRGIGARLLSALVSENRKPILIGTWKAATWAIEFYEMHGFAVLPDDDARALLEKFWSVPARQMETSVVLASQSIPNEALLGEVE